MKLVVFRSRLRPEARDEYGAVAGEIALLARETPGLIALKTFAAEDGERVTLAEFADEAAVTAWREHPRHREAQEQGRAAFYAEYRIQVCDVTRERRFRRAGEETEKTDAAGD